MARLSDDEIREFRERLEAFVIEERDRSRAQVHGIWALSLADRVQKGYAIEGLTAFAQKRKPRWLNR